MPHFSLPHSASLLLLLVDALRQEWIALRSRLHHSATARVFRLLGVQHLLASIFAVVDHAESEWRRHASFSIRIAQDSLAPEIELEISLQRM